MKSKKYRLISIFLLLILILIINYLQKDTYSDLTEDSINELRYEKNIEILNYKIVNNVDRPFAYVFFEKDKKIGSYIVRNINNKMIFNMEITIDKNINQAIQTIGIKTGYPYMMIRINDKKILENGKFILFSFGSEVQHKIALNSKEKDYIIVGEYGEGTNNNSSLEIFDKNKKVIHRQ